MVDDRRDRDDRLTWIEEFTVRSYEMDPWQRARVPVLTNWLQEVAGNHADALGWSVEDLQREGRTWMLRRLHVELSAWPRWQERVRVVTWPSSAGPVQATRDFELLRADTGARIGVATSAWVVVDMEKRRLLRIPPEVRKHPLPDRPRALDDPFRGELPLAGEGGTELRFRLRRGEIDMNLHANQTAYVAWAVEALPEETWREGRLVALEVAFLAEARYPAEIVSRCSRAEEGDGVFHHRLLSATDGRELARLRTRWVPR